jgi:integrase
MAARWYRRKDRKDRIVVYLNWKGKTYQRGWWDDLFPILHEDMANRLCGQINDDLSRKGRRFDPSVWFDKGASIKGFHTYADEWIERQTHLSNNSFPKAARTVKLIKEFQDWSQLPVDQIKAGHIEDFLKWLPAHLSTRSKKDFLGWLHKIFSDAYKREEVIRIPPFPRVNAPEKEIVWLSKEWQEKIINEIPEHERPAILFQKFFGCRVGETRAMKWDAVDFEPSDHAPWGRVTIKRGFSWDILKEYTKSKRIRTLPMDQSIRILLLSLRGKMTVRSIDGFVFLNRKGKFYGKNELTTVWNRGRDKAKCSIKASLYQGTRHSRGTQWIDEGKSMELVRAWLGHTRDDMTRRYARATGKGLEGLIE